MAVNIQGGKPPQGGAESAGPIQAGIQGGRPPMAPVPVKAGDAAAHGTGNWHGHIPDHGGSGNDHVHHGVPDSTSSNGGAVGTNPHQLSSSAQDTGVASGQHKAFK